MTIPWALIKLTATTVPRWVQLISRRHELCSESPILCFKFDNSSRPSYTATRSDFYDGWAGGHRNNRPVPGYISPAQPLEMGFAKIVWCWLAYGRISRQSALVVGFPCIWKRPKTTFISR